MQYVNNTRTSHNFKFDAVLGEKATQVMSFIRHIAALTASLSIQDRVEQCRKR